MPHDWTPDPITRRDNRPIENFFYDTGSLAEEIGDVPAGFYDFVREVAAGRRDIACLLPNWDYIRKNQIAAPRPRIDDRQGPT